MVNGLHLSSKICSPVGGIFLKALIFTEQHYEMAQPVLYTVFEIINNSGRAQAYSYTHFLNPIEISGPADWRKACFLWQAVVALNLWRIVSFGLNFSLLPCYTTHPRFQLASLDLDPYTMVLMPCSLIASLFLFPSLHLLLAPEKRISNLFSLVWMVSQIPASPSPVQAEEQRQPGWWWSWESRFGWAQHCQRHRAGVKGGQRWDWVEWDTKAVNT